MIIKNCGFVRSIKLKDDYFNEGLPEIAIVGKSNVGKSSLINMLTNNGKLARVSKQPGKTRLINYFLMNKSFYLVDLPGYGFARVSKEEKKSWDDMMRGYFEAAEHLKCVIILMDIRHKPTADDMTMLHFVEYYAIPYIIGATKADKIAKSKRYNECQKMRKEIQSSFAYEIVPLSSVDGYGKDRLLSLLDPYVAGEEAE